MINIRTNGYTFYVIHSHINRNGHHEQWKMNYIYFAPYSLIYYPFLFDADYRPVAGSETIINDLGISGRIERKTQNFYMEKFLKINKSMSLSSLRLRPYCYGSALIIDNRDTKAQERVWYLFPLFLWMYGNLYHQWLIRCIFTRRPKKTFRRRFFFFFWTLYEL